MLPEVAVLYSDFTVQRVSWTHKKNLALSNVLAVAIISNHELDEKRNRNRRKCLSGFDFYTLIWDNDFQNLNGYDDDFCWFSLTEPWKPHREGYRYRFPYILPDNSLLFRGIQLEKTDTESSAERWQKASIIITDLNGPMYSDLNGPMY